jgi:hypothetical protein
MISESYLRQQQLLHDSPAYGVASLHFAPLVAAVVRAAKPTSLCDYGAGKMRLLTALQAEGVSVPEYLPYDPAFPEYGEAVPADLVCCIDVLEHVEPEYLGALLKHLASLTKRLAFITVHTAPAVKHLPDGRNAHLIIEPIEWWKTVLSQYFEIAVCERDENPSAYYLITKVSSVCWPTLTSGAPISDDNDSA